MENIDTIDLQILKQLQENSNINIKELASKLFLTVTPVYERIKRLERDGYITKYVALLDKKKMNLGMTVFCNVRLKEHAKNVGSNFVKDIVALPEIIECYNIAGDYDFMLKILVEEYAQLSGFCDEQTFHHRKYRKYPKCFCYGGNQAQHGIGDLIFLKKS